MTLWTFRFKIYYINKIFVQYEKIDKGIPCIDSKIDFTYQKFLVGYELTSKKGISRTID